MLDVVACADDVAAVVGGAAACGVHEGHAWEEEGARHHACADACVDENEEREDRARAYCACHAVAAVGVGVHAGEGVGDVGVHAAYPHCAHLRALLLLPRSLQLIVTIHHPNQASAGAHAGASARAPAHHHKGHENAGVDVRRHVRCCYYCCYY